MNGNDFPQSNYDFQGSLVVSSLFHLPRQITASVRPSFPPEARQLTEPAAAEGPVQRRPRRLRAQETAAAHSDHGEDQLWLSCFNQWIGLRENLQETMVFTFYIFLPSSKSVFQEDFNIF